MNIYFEMPDRRQQKRKKALLCRVPWAYVLMALCVGYIWGRIIYDCVKDA